MLIIIFILSIIPLATNNIWNMGYIFEGFNIALLIFTIITFFKLRYINTSSKLQKYYLILIFLSLTSFNPISFNLFIQLDKFGLNV